jgi:hypothetical protein
MITTSIWLHSEKQSNREDGEKLGLTGEALDNFMYACYEVELTVEVDEETGESKIIACDGKKLAE